MTEARATPNERFYADLPELDDFERVVAVRHHSEAPASWHVVITDVRGSTQAIETGRYRDVNALGVASIIGLRNALPDVDLPFVFGGDGATVLVPGSRIAEVEAALRGLRAMAESAFGMGLRVAHVPIFALHDAGHPVRVGRYRMSRHVVLAALSGSGIPTAEAWIKDERRGAMFAVDDAGPRAVNLDGFECRWRPVESHQGRVVSLLVVALAADAAEREARYLDVLDVLRDLGQGDRSPISVDRLQLRKWNDDYSTEARVVSGTTSGPAYERARKRARQFATIGRTLVSTKIKLGAFDGRNYLREVVEHTDFRKFDEALRMVIDLTPDELERLRSFLDGCYRRGQLAYGIHSSSEALITCMVRSYDGNHVHFVDGAEGGYALAAKGLKAQLRAVEAALA